MWRWWRVKVQAALGDAGAWGGTRGHYASCKTRLQQQCVCAIGVLCETSWVRCGGGSQNPAKKVLLRLLAGVRAGGMLRWCYGVLVAVWLSVLNLEYEYCEWDFLRAWHLWYVGRGFRPWGEYWEFPGGRIRGSWTEYCRKNCQDVLGEACGWRLLH